MMKRGMVYMGLALALAWFNAAAGAVSTATAEEKAAKAAVSASSEGLRFNFRGAPLDTVLDYLSDAAGFVIVKQADVTGTVDAWSTQPLTKDEAVQVLNTVLNQKGYAVVPNGKILTIIRRTDVANNTIPVKVGRDPEKIPRDDAMATQVIACNYADADNLVENLKPLLPADLQGSLSANHGSNTLIMTAPQADIRRIAEIVKALDTSLATVSTVRVFTLQYADAKELATVVTEIFKPDDQTSSRDGGGARNFFRGMRGGPGGGGPFADIINSMEESASQAARRGAARVVAVADDRTNSLVVSAPDEMMTTIAELVNEVDTVAEDMTQIRVFPLKYSDATEMAEEITNIFEQKNQSGSQAQTQQFPRFFGGFGGRFGGGGGPGGRGGGGNQNNNQANNTNNSRRTIQENTVLAVADVRTNSVVVRAASELMPQIAEMVHGLDDNPAKAPKVEVYTMEHADPEQVANILRGMLNGESTTSSSSSGNQNLRSQNTANTRSNSNTGVGNNSRNNSNRNSGGMNLGF